MADYMGGVPCGAPWDNANHDNSYVAPRSGTRHGWVLLDTSHGFIAVCDRTGERHVVRNSGDFNRWADGHRRD